MDGKHWKDIMPLNKEDFKNGHYYAEAWMEQALCAKDPKNNQQKSIQDKLGKAIGINEEIGRLIFFFIFLGCLLNKKAIIAYLNNLDKNLVVTKKLVWLEYYDNPEECVYPQHRWIPDPLSLSYLLQLISAPEKLKKLGDISWDENILCKYLNYYLNDHEFCSPPMMKVGS